MNSDKKRILFFLLQIFLFGYYSLKAQDSVRLDNLVRNLNQALISRNEIQLNDLLHDKLTYGHSNGWIESKEDLIQNNKSKYLVYEKISMDSLRIKTLNDVSVIRFESAIDVILNGKSINLKLHVCQTWVKSEGHWKLLARQSTRIN